MILTTAEADSLVELQHRSPHELLGMHPLADGSGLVVRVFAPRAKQVDIVPVHEKSRPAIKLKKVHPAGLFEGSTNQANKVYAYDVVVTGRDGAAAQGRDPYSFLPTLGETDLYLFGQGNEHRIYEKLGAQSARAGRRARRGVRRVGAGGQTGQRGGRFQRMGRTPAHHAPAGRVGGLGDFRAGRGAGRALQI